jgi:hypothetical protein
LIHLKELLKPTGGEKMAKKKTAKKSKDKKEKK